MTIYSHELQSKWVWIEFVLTLYSPPPTPPPQKANFFQGGSIMGDFFLILVESKSATFIKKKDEPQITNHSVVNLEI